MNKQVNSLETIAKKSVLSVSSIITYLIIILVDGLLGYVTIRLASMGYIPLTIVFSIIIILITISFLIPKLHHLRWMAVALCLASFFHLPYIIHNLQCIHKLWRWAPNY